MLAGSAPGEIAGLTQVVVIPRQYSRADTFWFKRAEGKIAALSTLRIDCE
jgi:hypothetical protein